MDKCAIIKKLRIFLQNHSTFKEECEVVYLMVEIRKILEIDKNNSYQSLRFYCNWTLHVKLENKNTTQFISKMFDQNIDITKSGENTARKMLSNHADFFKLNDFKNELRKFFENNSLPLDLADKNKSWIAFIKLLLEIIMECPIICIESSKKIEKLELTKDMKDNYRYGFNLAHRKILPIIKLKFK